MWGLVVVLVVGGVVALVVRQGDAPDCPGHWHASLGVVVEGERVPFPQPPYNWEGEGGDLPFAMHMHRPDQEQLHFEPARPRCQGVQQTMALLDVRIEPGLLRFAGAHEQGPFGGEYRDDGEQVLRTFLEARGEGLREEPVDAILDYQLRDGEKLLVAYGDYAPEEIEVLMAQIDEPTG